MVRTSVTRLPMAGVSLFKSRIHVAYGTSHCGHCNMQMCDSGVDTVRN